MNELERLIVDKVDVCAVFEPTQTMSTACDAIGLALPLYINTMLNTGSVVGCHPSRFKGFKETMTADASAQSPIIIVSNHPYYVDLYPIENVLVWHNKNRWAFLSMHPDYEKWKDSMTAGEFWSHVGEDWVEERSQ